MNHKISFNTGRLYTSLGQVITVLILDQNGQNQTMFMDHSRGIGGMIEGIPDPEGGPEHIARWVMGFYDHGKYMPENEAMNLERLDTIHIVRI